MKRFLAIGLCTICVLLSLQGCAASVQPQPERPSWGQLDRQTVEWYRATHISAHNP